MSAQDKDDQPSRDPRFDAAWRGVSNEEPPPALDAALRAAARREVGAGPARADPALREATRPERWWFPLAAAATIGAIALGLLQIIEPARTSGDDPSKVVSDTPPGTTIPAREALPDTVRAPAAVTLGPASSGRGVVVPPAASMYPVAPEAARDEAATAARPQAKLMPRPAAESAAATTMGATEGTTASAERRRTDAAREVQDARAPLSVAEWIALIRKLRDEGRTDEAAKELAAFRNAHPDHEQRLPSDLARWRPDAK